MYVLHPEVQQSQQDDDGLLLVPRDVERDGQVVDVLAAEYLLEFQRHESPRVAVVALAGVQHTGNAADVAQVELVILVFGAARGEDDAVLGEGLGEVLIVGAVLHAAVATAHDEEAADGTAPDGLYNLVGQSEDLCVGEAADYLALLDFGRRLALLGQGYDFGEVLDALLVGHEVLPAGEAGGVGGEDAVAVVGIGGRGHDAVGGEDDGAVERGELLFLAPPGVAVVAHEVLVFLQFGVVVGREHFAVGVDVDALPLALLQELLEVAQVVAADEDAWAAVGADADAADFGVAVGRGVGLVEQGHDVDAPLAGLQHDGEQRVDRGLGVGHLVEGLGEEGQDGVVGLAEACGVLVVGAHAFESQGGKFAQRSHVGILGAQDAEHEAVGQIALAVAVVGHLRPVGQRHTVSLAFGGALGFELQAVLDFADEGFVVEVGTADGGEKGVDHEVTHAGALAHHAPLAHQVVDGAQAAHHGDQKILQTRCLGHFAAHATHGAATVLGGFLTLETKHFVAHFVCIWVNIFGCKSTAFPLRGA